MGHQILTPILTKKLKYEILDMINKYSDRTGLSDHFEPILIFQNPLRPSPLGFEVHTYVIFCQSGDHCPIIFCPLIKPHSIRNYMSINENRPLKMKFLGIKQFFS